MCVLKEKFIVRYTLGLGMASRLIRMGLLTSRLAQLEAKVVCCRDRFQADHESTQPPESFCQATQVAAHGKQAGPIRWGLTTLQNCNRDYFYTPLPAGGSKNFLVFSDKKYRDGPENQVVRIYRECGVMC